MTAPMHPSKKLMEGRQDLWRIWIHFKKSPVGPAKLLLSIPDMVLIKKPHWLMIY